MWTPLGRRPRGPASTLVPYVVHVHAKFWDMTDDLTDPHIPYDAVVDALVARRLQRLALERVRGPARPLPRVGHGAAPAGDAAAPRRRRRCADADARRADVKDVLVVDPAADWYRERLAAAGAQLHGARTFAEAEPYLERADAVITMGIPAMGLHLDGAVVGRMPRLEWVQCLLAGHEHLLPALAERPEVVRTRRRVGSTARRWPRACCCTCSSSRGASRSRSRTRRRGDGSRRPQTLLDGRVAVVVGLGSSGMRVARTCGALGMTVVGVSRTVRPVEVRTARAAGRAPGGRRRSRLPRARRRRRRGQPRPRRCRAVLGAMKPTAFVVNVSRGSVVDEDALVDALRDGVIAGAGLDVFATEPLPAESPLWELPNVFVTPHVAGRSDRDCGAGTRRRRAESAQLRRRRRRPTRQRGRA